MIGKKLHFPSFNFAICRGRFSQKFRTSFGSGFRTMLNINDGVFFFCTKIMCRGPKCVYLYEFYLDYSEINRNMLIYLQLKSWGSIKLCLSHFQIWFVHAGIKLSVQKYLQKNMEIWLMKLKCTNAIWIKGERFFALHISMVKLCGN